MFQSNIFQKIDILDSLSQERLFLIQKYKDFRFSHSYIKEKFPHLDLSSLI
jgi:hypothetical protein